MKRGKIKISLDADLKDGLFFLKLEPVNDFLVQIV